MSMHSRPSLTIWLIVLLIPGFAVVAQGGSVPQYTTDRPMLHESAMQHAKASSHGLEQKPSIPEDMTIDEVFDYAESPPPEDYPITINDDKIYAFTLFEILEYRVATEDTADQLGWEAQGWIGGDFNKFWWKNEGEAIFDGPDEGETETDLLYSRLIAPFWNLQFGAQYANEWGSSNYNDRWSGVIALQGLAPYKFELDNSLYISEDADVTFQFEAEYDIRITQLLVIQPKVELGFAFQDIPERDIGAGMTYANLDMRLRYEIKREFAPYIGIRYQFLVGETGSIAKDSGVDTDNFFFVAGLRFAF